jgi:hypothetical protein
VGDAASRRINLHNVGIDSSQVYCLPVRELVHRLLREVESITSNIDGEHIDAVAIVRELPASSAGRGVISANSRCASDSGEAWKRTECGVAPCEKTIRAVGASNGGQRRASVVVGVVPRDRNTESWRCSSSECKRSEESVESELHGERG